MQYDLNYDAELGIVALTIRGDITSAEIDDSATAAARMAKEKGSDKLLTDCRQARVRMNTLQIHEVPGRISELVGAPGVDVPYLRCALVATEDLRDYEFFETVSVNRGQPVKLFTDIDEARRWLVGTGAEASPI